MKVEIKPSNNLSGNIKISGSKNSCLPILAISLLTDKKMIIRNVPNITDIDDMLKLLEYIGVKVARKKDTVILKRKHLKNKLLIDEVTKIRASYYLIPGLVNKHKEVQIYYPGGCTFTNRPIDYHLYFLRKSNVEILEQIDKLILKKKKLKPANIVFPKATVGATINAILHYVQIKGTTKIKSQPLEPEILDVINCLNKMGALIYIKNNEIIIKGGRKLKKIEYKIMPDRIEFASYALLASTRNSQVTLTNILENTYLPFLKYFDNLGIKYIYNKESFTVLGSGKINNIHLIIDHFPYFPTDLNPIICAALLNGTNESFVYDLVYPKRISHIKQMQLLSANIKQQEKGMMIIPSLLEGAEVYAKDLRCGFALIICAINASNKTIINEFEFIKRGYERVVEKLKSINIQIDEY